MPNIFGYRRAVIYRCSCCKWIGEMGHKVIVLDDLSGWFEENVNPKAKIVQGSVTDHELVDRLFVIMHWLCISFGPYAAEGLEVIFRFNYTNNLVEVSISSMLSVLHKVKCFCFLLFNCGIWRAQATDAGRHDTDAWRSLWCSKYAIELDLRNLHEIFGLNSVIFRPHNVYGEYRGIWRQIPWNVVGIFYESIDAGKELSSVRWCKANTGIQLYRNMALLHCNYVNVPAAMNQIFNIGADREFTINELAITVQNAMDLSGKSGTSNRGKEVVHAYAVISKAKECRNKWFSSSKMASEDVCLGKEDRNKISVRFKGH